VFDIVACNVSDVVVGVSGSLVVGGQVGR